MLCLQGAELHTVDIVLNSKTTVAKNSEKQKLALKIYCVVFFLSLYFAEIDNCTNRFKFLFI